MRPASWFLERIKICLKRLLERLFVPLVASYLSPSPESPVVPTAMEWQFLRRDPKPLLRL